MAMNTSAMPPVTETIAMKPMPMSQSPVPVGHTAQTVSFRSW